jgi:hypothetical protein
MSRKVLEQGLTKFDEALFQSLLKLFDEDGVGAVDGSKVTSVSDPVTGEEISDPEAIGEMFGRLVASGRLVEETGDDGTKLYRRAGGEVAGASDAMTGSEMEIANRALSKVMDLKSAIEVKFFYLGGALKEVFVHEHWKAKGYKGFDEYVEKEVDLKRRMARYLIRVYEVFTEIDKNLPDGRVLTKLQMMGTTKAIELVGVVNGSNFDEWATRAQGLTVRELKRMVASSEGGGTALPKSVDGKLSDSGEPMEKMTRLTFVLAPEQLKNINMALEVLREETKSDKTGHLLDTMASILLSHYGDKAPTDVMLANVERSTGLRLIAFSAEGDCIHGEELLANVTSAVDEDSAD